MRYFRRLICLFRGHEWDRASLYVVPKTYVRKNQLVSLSDCDKAGKKCLRCGRLKSVLPIIWDKGTTCDTFPDIEWEPDE